MRGPLGSWRWLVAASALLVTVVLSGVTVVALNLERDYLESRAHDERQTSLRLALWRLDSYLVPLVAREAARPLVEGLLALEASGGGLGLALGAKRETLTGLCGLGDLVLTRAGRALDAGADGVIASPQEAAAIRALPEANGKLIVTPGVRPQGAALGDQKRVATPGQAIADGADHIVVGRPIWQAEDPAAAARAVLAELP